MAREQCAPADLFPDVPTAPADLAEVLPWEFLEYELAPYVAEAVEHIEHMMQELN